MIGPQAWDEPGADVTIADFSGVLTVTDVNKFKHALFHGIGHLVADYCKFGGLKLKDKLVASIAGDGRDIKAYTFENIIFINGILPPTSMSGRMEIINTLNCTLEGTNKKIESSSFEMRKGRLFMNVKIGGR